MREWQALPHLVHVKTGLQLVCDLGCCFLSSFLFLIWLVFLSSACRLPILVVVLQLLRFEVAACRSAGFIPQSLRSRLQTSLKRRLGRPVGLAPVASSPNRRSLGMRPSSIRQMWPSQRIRFCFRMHYMLLVPALSRMSSFLMRSCQVMPRSRRRQRMWKVLSFLSWLE